MKKKIKKILLRTLCKSWYQLELFLCLYTPVDKQLQYSTVKNAKKYINTITPITSFLNKQVDLSFELFKLKKQPTTSILDLEHDGFSSDNK